MINPNDSLKPLIGILVSSITLGVMNIAFDLLEDQSATEPIFIMMSIVLGVMGIATGLWGLGGCQPWIKEGADYDPCRGVISTPFGGIVDAQKIKETIHDQRG